MKVPTLVLAFNRADHVVKAMEAIREYKPERLYLECDGARPHKSGEAEAVELTRKVQSPLWFTIGRVGIVKTIQGLIRQMYQAYKKRR